MLCFQTNAENAGLSEREKGCRVFQEFIGTHDVVQVKVRLRSFWNIYSSEMAAIYQRNMDQCVGCVSAVSWTWMLLKGKTKQKVWEWLLRRDQVSEETEIISIELHHWHFHCCWFSTSWTWFILEWNATWSRSVLRDINYNENRKAERLNCLLCRDINCEQNDI